MCPNTNGRKKIPSWTGKAEPICLPPANARSSDGTLQWESCFYHHPTLMSIGPINLGFLLLLSVKSPPHAAEALKRMWLALQPLYSVRAQYHHRISFFPVEAISYSDNDQKQILLSFLIYLGNISTIPNSISHTVMPLVVAKLSSKLCTGRNSAFHTTCSSHSSLTCPRFPLLCPHPVTSQDEIPLSLAWHLP